MSDHNIVCPECQHQFPLSQTLSTQMEKELQAKFLEEQEKQKSELEKKKAEIEAQQKIIKAELDAQKELLAKESEAFEKKVEEKLQQEKLKMWEVAQQKAQEKIGTEMKDLQAQMQEKEKKLREAQETELEIRKKTRELEDKQKSMELEIQRKLDEERNKVLEQAKKDASEENRLKIQEKDKQMEILKKTIEDLKRQSEQGSMQIQGDAQENDLRDTLKATFITDIIEDVPAGVRGADLIQTVRNNLGQKNGIILWESKNTKTWSNDWIKKLKGDQGIAKADICILVTQVLPDDIDGFGLRDGVWISDYKHMLDIASALRFHLVEISRVKNSLIGRDQKMEYLYEYLSGPEFKNRIENIVLAFSGMKKDLETEKRSMHRIWNKREKEIERVILNTSGMYGDLQGIIGASLPVVESLELSYEQEALEEENENTPAIETPREDIASDTEEKADQEPSPENVLPEEEMQSEENTETLESSENDSPIDNQTVEMFPG